IKRLEDGSKTLPVFPKEWRSTYQEHFNEKVTALGGAITGAVSGFIAVDCDNEQAVAIFDSLHPNHPFVFRSRGKKGATFIYKYDEVLSTSFSIADDTLKLDFYSNNGFIYLPTTANESKEPWSAETLAELPSIPEVPPTIKALLKQLALSKVKANLADATKPQPQRVASANFLAPQVQLFITKKTFL